MAVIFISRGTMTGVRKLVGEIHAQTGIRCISREDLVDRVSEQGEWATAVIKKIVQATSDYAHFSEYRRPYIILMRQALLKEIVKGDLLYHGFSGHLLLPRISNFVRIRIDAPMELRIVFTRERLGLEEDDARSYIVKKDDERISWARFMYGKDIRDISQYDLHLCLGHLPMPVILNIFKQLLSDSNLQNTPEIERKVKSLLLATDIEAALVCDTRTRNFDIHAKFENGNVTLVGPYLEEMKRKTVLSIARMAAPGIEIRYTPGYVYDFDLEECLR